MSQRNPWQPHGFQWQTQSGTVPLFDPSQFAGAMTQGVNNPQPHGFEQGAINIQQQQQPEQHPDLQADAAGFTNTEWNQQDQQLYNYCSPQGDSGGQNFGNDGLMYSGYEGYPECETVSGGNFENASWHEGYMFNENFPNMPGEFQGSQQQQLFEYMGQQTGYQYEDYNHNFNQVAEDQDVPGNVATSSVSGAGVNPSSEASQFDTYHQENINTTVARVDHNMTVLPNEDNESGQHLPASSSFSMLPHHPSPFDEIGGFVADNKEKEKQDRLSLPASASHSRESSCGGAKFVIGSSEHIPNLDEKQTGLEMTSSSINRQNVVLETVASQTSVVKQEIKDALKGDATGSGDFTSLQDHHDLPSGQNSVPNLPMVRPGTMTGIPAKNQFRKAPEGKSNPSGTVMDILSAPFYIPPKVFNPSENLHESNHHQPMQCTGSSGASADDATGALPSVDLSHMHCGGAMRPFEENLTPADAEPAHSQAGEAGRNHQMNIYVMPIAPHPGSSFVPVGSMAASNPDPAACLPEGYSETAAMSGTSDLDSFHQPDMESRTYGNSRREEPKIEPATVAQSANVSSGLSNVGKNKPVTVHKEAEMRARHFGEGPGQLHSALHKHPRDNTMSPGATLWENPVPPAGIGICLFPAAGANREEASGQNASTDAVEQLQNTGTGPGKKTGSLPVSSGIQQNVPVFGLATKGSGDMLPMQIVSQQLLSNRSLISGDHEPTQHNTGGDSTVQNIVSSGSVALPHVTTHLQQLVSTETMPSVVALARKESVDSLTDEIIKSRDSSDRKETGHSTKPVDNFLSGSLVQAKLPGSDYPKKQGQAEGYLPSSQNADLSGSSIIQNFQGSHEVPGADGVNEARDRGGGFSQDSRVPQRNVGKNGPRGGQSENDPRDRPDGRKMHEQDYKASFKQEFSQDSIDRSKPIQTYPNDPYKAPKSRQDFSENPADRSRQGYHEDPYGRPTSRQGYSEDSYVRPNSRQGHPEDPYRRPSSRQDFPEESYGRPTSRQGHPEDPYRRPSSKQGYPEDSYVRPSSRQSYPEDPYIRPSSRQGSRPDHPEERYNRSRTDHRPREDYRELDSYNRSGSWQGYPPESRDQQNSKDGYHHESYYRPRSRQGNFDEDYYDDQKVKRERYNEDRNRRPSDRYERYDFEGANREGRTYADRYREDERSRYGYHDDYEYKGHQRYSDENYNRPRSRQGDSEYQLNENAQHESDVSRSHSRHYSDRSRSDYDPRYRDRRNNREQSDYYNYEIMLQKYYQYYMAQGGYPSYIPYAYPNSHDKGLFEEMIRCGQMPAYYPGYGYDESYERPPGDRQGGSARSSTRGSSPGPVNLASAADNFAQEYNEGSRPGSSFNDVMPSPMGGSEIGLDSCDAYGYHADSMQYPETVRHRMTPLKFVITHTRAAFSPTGQLIHILPNSPVDGQPAVVQLIDVASLVNHEPEVEELTRCPGPLTRREMHKNDVLLFCQKMALICRNNVGLIDRESAELLWHYLELLIKQNGTIIGTDVASLLLEGHEPTSNNFTKSGFNAMGESHEDLEVNEEGASWTSSISADRSQINRNVTDMGTDEIVERFRHLLLHGRKKDALDWAVKKSLWGHALYLASKMDAKTHASTMTKFTTASMKMNDPLQTLYQIMSGRQPTAVTLIADDRWGDWRPHLSIIISNPTQKVEVDRKSIVALGDALATRGLFYGANFCYLIAPVSFGQYHKKSSKLVLIGASHSLPFEEFASNFAIQCTESYEYGMSLGNPKFVLPTFQVYKFIYMVRLMDYGLMEEALRYAEVLAGIIVEAPNLYPPTLVKALYNLSFGLCQCDLSEEGADLVWFMKLREVICRMEEGSIQYLSGHGTPVGGVSTGASSEVAEILEQNQPGELGQQLPATFINTTIHGGYNMTPYQGVQGQWSGVQQQTFWNQAGQTHTLEETQWDQTQIGNAQMWQQQQQQWFVSAGNVAPAGEVIASATESNSSMSVVATSSSSTTDQTDGSSSLGHYVPNFAHYPVVKSGSYMNDGAAVHGFNSYSIPYSDSMATLSSGSAISSRQRTTSSSSSHSQQRMSSRRTSSSTVHGATPPSSPGHQMVGTTHPLASVSEKRKQYWPGEDDDEDEKKAQNGSKPGKTLGKAQEGNKSTGWLSLFTFGKSSKPKEMILPDDKNPKIVWDDSTKQWVDKDKDPKDPGNAPPPPPPKDADVSVLSTPKIPMMTPGEFSSNKFSRPKVRGPQYVDVLSSSSKPSPLASESMLNMMPKSASMPANIFIPNALASEGEREVSGVQPTASEATATAAPGSTAPYESNPAEQNPHQVQQKTLRTKPEPQMTMVNSTEGAPPSMPLMFDPSKFSQGVGTPVAQPTNAGSHFKYGQRRMYPK